MPIKRVLSSQRLRRVPSQFSWVDHRLVRDRHICRCSAQALALYLFLVTVADAQGLSYYSDKRICGMLSMNWKVVVLARQELINASLIAYQRPLYQVLALDNVPTEPQVPTELEVATESELSTEPERRSPWPPQSLGQILRRAMEQAK